ncbi:hypothetical protein [Haliangium ochraceum]|uniref:DUF4149 domain-containing protein n=1 Tax=Haliangium ochraceum (strain DSM 14365 / JCM 11303 / SMP-2) TaxID=502025 RepID=D0LRL5_HALO1|nr:hypothetical protein [Haliangium ochraceum]ACY19007.1 hypothetical protein Hoch_6538 [Haliangium ochraceum DSM 14365]
MDQSVSPAAPRPWAARALLWLLGVWFALSVCMAFIASANFRALSPDNLRQADEVFAVFADTEARRVALRYAASELNRSLFTTYSAVHVVIAAAAFALLWLVPQRGRRRLWMALALGTCALFALIFVAWFTPTMVELGRQIDFLPRDPEPALVSEFYRLHRINVAMEMIKLTLIAAVSVALVRR